MALIVTKLGMILRKCALSEVRNHKNKGFMKTGSTGYLQVTSESSLTLTGSLQKQAEKLKSREMKEG